MSTTLYESIVIGVLEACIQERTNKDETPLEAYQRLKKNLEISISEEMEKQILEDFNEYQRDSIS